MERIGDKIRKLREDRCLSQSELARMAGISRTSQCMIESGQRNPSPRTIRKYAGALGVGYSEILGKGPDLRKDKKMILNMFVCPKCLAKMNGLDCAFRHNDDEDLCEEWRDLEP